MPNPQIDMETPKIKSVEEVVDVVAYHKELAIRKFTNELAMQLKPSNDTMEAIRLFRSELPDFLTVHDRSLHTSLVAAVEKATPVYSGKGRDDMEYGGKLMKEITLTIINSIFKE